MDQLACAVGGIIFIDFKNAHNPLVERVNHDFNNTGYSVLVVDTCGSHLNLTAEYAAIPEEMKNIAKAMNAETLADVCEEEFIENLSELRKKCGDRAVLRAFHFFKENKRVENQVVALKEDNILDFLKFVESSGNSSFKLVQNIYPPQNIRNQEIALALTLTENYLKEKETGACRVHGGGFGGTILAFLPNEYIEEYTQKMENAFRAGCVRRLSIRQHGTIHINEL